MEAAAPRFRTWYPPDLERLLRGPPGRVEAQPGFYLVIHRFHRYFPDFVVKSRTKDGKVKTLMLEVKPKKQTMEPAKKKRVSKQYIQEVVTWGVNQAKWQAAEEFCLDRGWEFKILTEDHLNV